MLQFSPLKKRLFRYLKKMHIFKKLRISRKEFLFIWNEKRYNCTKVHHFFFFFSQERKIKNEKICFLCFSGKFWSNVLDNKAVDFLYSQFLYLTFFNKISIYGANREKSFSSLQPSTPQRVQQFSCWICFSARFQLILGILS